MMASESGHLSVIDVLLKYRAQVDVKADVSTSGVVDWGLQLVDMCPCGAVL